MTSMRTKFKYHYALYVIGISLSLMQCGIYSFTGASIPAGTETFQVNYFNNTAGNRPGSTTEPGLDQEFTIALQDLLLNQTNLNLVSSGGDLVYEGEITQYSISPTTSTANNTAAQNRLTMSVNVRYINSKKEEDSFEQRFSFFYDFDAKYKVGGSQHTVPANVPDEVTELTYEWAERAFTILGCRGVARADFIWDEDEDQLYMLEINTQPGMTATSLTPEQAAFCGISGEELVNHLLEIAQCDE